MKDDFELCLLEGLDDIAHNRLLTSDKRLKSFTPVKNYGKRNKEAKCYCKEIASRRVRARNK